MEGPCSSSRTARSWRFSDADTAARTESGLSSQTKAAARSRYGLGQVDWQMPLTHFLPEPQRFFDV